MKLWEQLFAYQGLQIDYSRGDEVMYFYRVKLKVKIGNNPPGTQFDTAVLSFDNSTIFFENEDQDEDEDEESTRFKLKLTVSEEV